MGALAAAMIRFMPDSWLDVVMRPLDMISPEGNIYVEVQAPDLRLAAVLLLFVAVLASAGRQRPGRRPAFQLLALTLLAMVPWFATTGNGRYFTAFLLLLGPLCVGLVRLLPLSTSMKFSAVGLLLAGQAFLLNEGSPWGSWALLPWRDAPYFQLAAPPAQPRSYVTLTPISFSLIAPQFPEQSRWMNISAPVNGPREREYARKWLADTSLPLYLVAPTYPSQVEGDLQPSAAVQQVFNQLIRARGLSLVAGARCDFLRSRGLAGMAQRGGGANKSEDANLYGFWLCPLAYDPAAVDGGAGVATSKDPAVEAAFDAVEKLCPRFFPPGEAQTQRIDGGATRHYPSSDTRLYVMEDGEVAYKFWRSINPVTIGRRADVLAGHATVECGRIRSGIWRNGGL